MKYIITDTNAIALFSDTCVHQDMARGMWGKPVSAGQCRIKGANTHDEVGALIITCWGKSTTLNLESRPEQDQKIIEKVLND